MNKEKIILGTRGSKLALWQANFIKEELETASAGLEVELLVIKTQGDTRHDLDPGAFGREGIFTAELDRALLDHKIDLAVHSLKDLPTRLGKGLALAAVTERAAISDTLILRQDHAEAITAKIERKIDFSLRHDLISDLMPSLVVGTSSLRRQAFLKHLWPNLRFGALRGNLDTRIRKLGEKELDALVVATAGLHRLMIPAKGHLFIPIDAPFYLPAAGQGALGLETRSDGAARDLAALLNHEATFIATGAERAAMAKLRAGCRVPAGFLGEVDGINLILRGTVASVDGAVLIQAEAHGEDVDYGDVGRKLADDLLEQGADEILKEVRE